MALNLWIPTAVFLAVMVWYAFRTMQHQSRQEGFAGTVTDANAENGTLWPRDPPLPADGGIAWQIPFGTVQDSPSGL